MASFEIQGADGSIYDVEAPDYQSAVSAFKKMGADQPPAGEQALMSELSGLTENMGRTSGVGGSILRGADNSLRFGLGDEMAGLAEASGLPVGTPPLLTAPIGGVRMLFSDDARKRYETGRSAYLGQERTDEAQHPYARLGGQVGGAVLQGIPAAGLVNAGASLPVRIGQSAAIGGALGAAQGAGSGDGAEDRLQQAITGGAVGGAFGAGGELIATGAGKLVRKTLGAETRAAPGVIPEERIAAAAEFNVPLTRGQATGNTAQQAWEEAARHNARGIPAGNRLQSFDTKQATALDAAKRGMMGGDVAAVDAGDVAAQALRERATGLRTTADSFYKSAAGKDAHIASDAVAGLGQKVSASLDELGITLDNYGNYPGAQSAMNLLRRVSGFEGAGDGKVVAQSLQGIEQARQGLLKVKGANAADWRALKAIRSSFDDWMSDAIDKSLFAGDKTALDDLIKARSLWSGYRNITVPGKSDSSKIVAKIATEDRTGQEVANWLLGTAGAQQAGRSARVAATLKSELGATSEAWEALRQAAWTKAVNPTQGQGGPQAVSKSIDKLITGEGAPLAKVLFNADELGKMKRLSAVIKTTIPDPKATNPSKSGYEIARSLGIAGTAISGGVGGTWMTGDPKYLAIAALPLLKAGSSLSKGVAATRAAPSALGATIGKAARVPAIAGASLYGEQ
jgi:hypothetical protein